MCAELIKYGEFSPGVGGDFEALSARGFRDGLPAYYTLVSNVSLRRRSSFLECDLIVAGPRGCDILEMKCIRPTVFVGEDHLEGADGFRIDRVFSLLALKANVLRDRLKSSPFTVNCGAVPVRFAVVVPDDTVIRFDSGLQDARVFRLTDAIRLYTGSQAQGAVPPTAIEFMKAWTEYRDKEDGGARQSAKYLGRFHIKERLASDDGTNSYVAFDEAPCPMELHLKEFPFDPTATGQEIRHYLDEISRELRTLRRIRHPHVTCVVGHFQTGASWVQVSDWFDGTPLEHQWAGVRDLSVHDRIALCVKLAEALAYCHQREVFHRHVSARNVLVNSDFDEVCLAGFELAKDLRLTSTVGVTALGGRDPRLMTPEELSTGHPPNPRMADTFQLGLLFYRIFNDGQWPYADPLEYCSTGGMAKTGWPAGASLPVPLCELLTAMLDVLPARRPDPLSRVVSILSEVSKAATDSGSMPVFRRPDPLHR